MADIRLGCGSKRHMCGDGNCRRSISSNHRPGHGRLGKHSIRLGGRCNRRRSFSWRLWQLARCIDGCPWCISGSMLNTSIRDGRGCKRHCCFAERLVSDGRLYSNRGCSRHHLSDGLRLEHSRGHCRRQVGISLHGLNCGGLHLHRQRRDSFCIGDNRRDLLLRRIDWHACRQAAKRLQCWRSWRCTRWWSVVGHVAATAARER